MKRCLECRSTYDGPEWTCQACGASPARIDGFIAFAPDLAASNDGMEPDAHHRLDRLQDFELLVSRAQPARGGFSETLLPGSRTRARDRLRDRLCVVGSQSALPQSCLSGSEIYVNGLSYAANRVGPQVSLFQMDARDIPYVAEFDLICAFDVIEHVEEDERVLEELRRALRPGGGVLLSVPQHPFLWSRADEVSFHKRRYRPGELSSSAGRPGSRSFAPPVS